ncbi:MAG: 50S ribosome-binding GTPase, partial [Solobacterium sp.]|nr:50S ribosome-binding GTPase [Solobacterium sp.]
AGKSSLLNALISMSESTPGKEAGVRDMLFATLDTSVRSVTYGTASFFLYDTVGFVSDLPHELIEAFHSTLRAACDADLLIHVIDGSDPMREMKTEAAEQALQDIGASGIPSIRVYTKCDLVKDRHEGFMYVSSLTKEGIGDLLQMTADLLYGADTCIECVIPYDKMQLYERYSRVMRCTVLAQTENGLHVIMRGSENYMKLFRVYERKDYEQNSMGKTE